MDGAVGYCAVSSYFKSETTGASVRHSLAKLPRCLTWPVQGRAGTGLAPVASCTCRALAELVIRKLCVCIFAQFKLEKHLKLIF